MPRKNTHRPSTRHVTCKRCGKVLIGAQAAGAQKYCPDCVRIMKQEKLQSHDQPAESDGGA